MTYIASADSTKMNDTQLNHPDIATGGKYGDFILVTMYKKDITQFLQAGYDSEGNITGITSEDDITYYTRKEAQEFVAPYKVEVEG